MTPHRASSGDGRVTVLIADDERLAREGLRHMLALIDWLRCVGEAANGPDAVTMIDALEPDLVFLDIRMPGLHGTDVPARARHQPYIVFTTAYAQHAVTAFELGALDYLLKPFGAQRLATTLERIRSAVGEPGTPPPIDRLSEALRAGPMTRLFVRSGRAIVPVAVASVAWFEARGDYVAAQVSAAPGVGQPARRHLLHLSLSRLEERLDPSRFTRIHRGCIVNLDHVVAFRRRPLRGVEAEMRDGTRLAVSRTRARELRALGL